jgi:hypothetical protein
MKGATRVADEWLFTDARSRIAGIGDVDGNARADIILRSPEIMSVNVFRLGAPLVTLGDAVQQWFIAATPDIDGDGDIDLCWRNTATTRASAWTLEDAAWDRDNLFLKNYPLTRTFVDAADIDGDGDEDIVTFNESSRAVTTMLMSAGGPGEEILAGTAPSGASIVAVGDLDGDFRGDIVWRSGTTLLLWRNNGAGTFTESTLRTGVPESLTFIR